LGFLKFGILRNLASLIGWPITRPFRPIDFPPIRTQRDLDLDLPVPCGPTLSSHLLSVQITPQSWFGISRFMLHKILPNPLNWADYSLSWSRWTLRTFCVFVSSTAEGVSDQFYSVSNCEQLFWYPAPRNIYTKQLSVPPCPDAGAFFYHQPDDTLDLSTFTFTMSIRATNLPPFLHRAGKNIQDGDGVLPSDARVCDTDAVLEAALAFLWDLLVTCICVSVFQRLTEADGVPTYLRRCCSQS